MHRTFSRAIPAARMSAAPARASRATSARHRAVQFGVDRSRERPSVVRGPIEELEPRVLLATFAVTTTADFGPGSLRQAILDANATMGADRVEFALPGLSPHRITVPGAGLPAVAESLAIDATTQPGFAGSPVVELVGTTNASGLVFAAGTKQNEVRGLAVGGFDVGVQVLGQLSKVAGNYLGLSADGAALPNRVGVEVYTLDNEVGGLTGADRNVISGNRSFGVRTGRGNVWGAVARVRGNLIGTTIHGTAAVPNDIGIYAESDGSTPVYIGGTEPGARNVISGNNTAGVFLIGGTARCHVEGNFIGTDVSGSFAVANGVGIRGATDSGIVGGTTPEARNVISGNRGAGILIEGYGGALIVGNFIGPDATGTRALGNGGPGVEGRGMQTVGGTAPGEGNVIAFNAGPGVAVMPVFRIAGEYATVNVRGNSIYCNGGLPIDLGADGPTPNDPSDTDVGPNGLQNFPVLSFVSSVGGSTRVRGTLPSATGRAYALDFFADGPDGQVYLGSAEGVAPNAPFDVTLAAAVEPGRSVTATASTVAKYGASTSEISPGVVAPIPGDADRDGRVAFADLLVVAQNFDTTGKDWGGGDFTGDGAVDFSDLLVAQNYDRALDAGVPVPAPAPPATDWRPAVMRSPITARTGTGTRTVSTDPRRLVRGKPRASPRPTAGPFRDGPAVRPMVPARRPWTAPVAERAPARVAT